MRLLTRFDEIKKEACFILGLLAVKPEYQAQISQAGALPGLVKLLRAHKPTAVTRVVPGSGGVARRAADAITNLAHENVDIKVRVQVWVVVVVITAVQSGPGAQD